MFPTIPRPAPTPLGLLRASVCIQWLDGMHAICCRCLLLSPQGTSHKPSHCAVVLSLSCHRIPHIFSNSYNCIYTINVQLNHLQTTIFKTALNSLANHSYICTNNIKNKSNKKSDDDDNSSSYKNNINKTISTVTIIVTIQCSGTQAGRHAGRQTWVLGEGKAAPLPARHVHFNRVDGGATTFESSSHAAAVGVAWCCSRSPPSLSPCLPPVPPRQTPLQW